MDILLPAGFVWREHGRLAWCTCCTAVVPCSNEKLLKQHLKSKTHKKAAQHTPLTLQQIQQQGAPAGKQHVSSCTVAPEDYQPHHLEALHIAGTYSDEDPYAGLYYAAASCNCPCSTRELSSRELSQLQQETNLSCSSRSSTGAGNLQQRCSRPHPVSEDDETLCQQLQCCQLESATDSIHSPATSRNGVAHQQQHPSLNHKHHQQGPCSQQQMRPCWPVPFALKPKAALAAGVPFLTLQCGSIPWVPANLEEALEHYCQPGACRLPNIDTAGVNQQVKSWSHAAKLLRAAAASQHSMYTADPDINHHTAASGSTTEAHRQAHAVAQSQLRSGVVPFWASLVADISHPPWWPKTGHVPTYDNVIIGAGPSGIGIHRDVDHSVCHNPPPVSTYLTVVRGRKHVIVMPPDQTLFPVDDQIPFPVDPSPESIQAVKAAGGAYFDLQPTPDGAPVTLYMPAGWLHWLIGASDWHAVFGGSLYHSHPGYR